MRSLEPEQWRKRSLCCLTEVSSTHFYFGVHFIHRICLWASFIDSLPVQLLHVVRDWSCPCAQACCLVPGSTRWSCSSFWRHQKLTTCCLRLRPTCRSMAGHCVTSNCPYSVTVREQKNRKEHTDISTRSFNHLFWHHVQFFLPRV